MPVYLIPFERFPLWVGSIAMAIGGVVAVYISDDSPATRAKGIALVLIGALLFLASMLLYWRKKRRRDER